MPKKKDMDSYLDKRSKELLEGKKKREIPNFKKVGKVLTIISIIAVLVLVFYLKDLRQEEGFEHKIDFDNQPQQEGVQQQQAPIQTASLNFDKNTRFVSYPSASEFYANPKKLQRWIRIGSGGEEISWGNTNFASPRVVNNGKGTAKNVVIEMEIPGYSRKVSSIKEEIKPRESWIFEDMYPDPLPSVLDIKSTVDTKIVFTLSYDNGKEIITETHEMPYRINARGTDKIGSPTYDFKIVYYVTPVDPSLEPYMCQIQKGSSQQIKNMLSCVWDKLGRDLEYKDHDGYWYPAETLAKGEGVCRDFSALFASIFERVGLKSKIIASGNLGHALVGYYDGNEWVYLEGTLVGRSDFERALEIGLENFESAKKTTYFYEIEPRFLWENGIRPPAEIKP